MEAVCRNIIERLVSLGLVSEEKLVDGSSILGMGRQRNRFFYYKQCNSPSFFIKQASGDESGAEASLLLESMFYQCVESHTACSGLKEVMPRFFDFEIESGTLIIQMFFDSEDMGSMTRRTKRVDRGLLHRFGMAAACIHSTPTVPFQEAGVQFDGEPHWIFRLNDNPSPLPSLRGRSPAGAKFIDMILGDVFLMEMLVKRRAEWRSTNLIHGDYKWENALVVHDADDAIRIIDWERANIGDPAWDIGYAFAACLLHDAMIVQEAGAVPNVPELSAQMASFWQGYKDGGFSAKEDCADFLARAIDMMAARLLIAAFERCYAENEVPVLSQTLLRRARSALGKDGDRIRQALVSESALTPR